MMSVEGGDEVTEHQRYMSFASLRTTMVGFVAPSHRLRTTMVGFVALSHRRRACTFAVTLLALLVVTATASAQPAPYHHYRTLDTPHFRITVPSGLEREGRVAG